MIYNIGMLCKLFKGIDLETSEINIELYYRNIDENDETRIFK